MRKTVFSVLIFLMAYSVQSYGSSIPDFPFVLVSGESKIEEKPDMAEMTIYLSSFNKDSSIANNEILETVEYIVSTAKQLKIPSENLTLKPISKIATRNRNEQYQNLEIIGYEVSREVIVKFKSLESFTDFSDKIASRNNVERSNTVFGSSREQEINKSLVKNACENAKSKASLLVDGLGVKLGSVFAVTQDAEFSDVTAVFEIKSNGSASWDSLGGSSQSKIEIIPKSIEFKKSVNVVYKISE